MDKTTQKIVRARMEMQAAYDEACRRCNDYNKLTGNFNVPYEEKVQVFKKLKNAYSNFVKAKDEYERLALPNLKKIEETIDHNLNSYDN